MSNAQLQTALDAWPSVKPALFVPRTAAEYHELVQLLDQLTDQVGEDEAHPLASLMEVVGVLVENYEQDHVPELTD